MIRLLQKDVEVHVTTDDQLVLIRMRYEGALRNYSVREMHYKEDIEDKERIVYILERMRHTIEERVNGDTST